MGVHPSLLLWSASVFPAGAGGEPCRGEAGATLPLSLPPRVIPSWASSVACGSLQKSAQGHWCHWLHITSPPHTTKPTHGGVKMLHFAGWRVKAGTDISQPLSVS